MQIDHCLILAAGFGTRMGKIGQKLPKVLWPVFEKSLLELQVAYAKSLGVTNIYINLHNAGEEIEKFCKDKYVFEGVKFLWEKPEILDIGGAVHNLAAQKEVSYKGKLLVLNADQFFYMAPNEFMRLLTPYEKSPVVLLSYWVNSSLGYNALEIDANRMVKNITKNKDLPKNQTVETYTGISLIDLAQLKPVKGVSPFFESVCPIGKQEIPAVLLENVDYWDFGTVERYWETCFRMLTTYRNQSTHPFLRFLVQERALKTWKINLQEPAYHAKFGGIINLNADEEIRDLGKCIILSGQEVSKSSGKSIWWQGIEEKLS